MTTNLVSVLWIAWAAFALVTALLYAYRARVTRDEEGQIFLDEAFAHEERTQSDITMKVNRLQPVLRMSVALTGLMTAVVIAYYLWFGFQALFG
jgi:hypothetical protein